MSLKQKGEITRILEFLSADVRVLTLTLDRVKLTDDGHFAGQVGTQSIEEWNQSITSLDKNDTNIPKTFTSR